MKKIAILAITMFAALGAFAQFNQGRMLVGGDAEFNTNVERQKSGGTTVTDGRRKNFSLGTQFGYFVIDNLVVGGGLSVGLSKWADQDGSDFDYTTTSMQLRPFVRYYLPQGIFFQAQAGIGASKTKYNDGDEDDKYGMSSLALSVGYAIFLNDNVAVEPMLGYRSTGYKNKGTDVKDIDSGLFISIGFQIYLGNK